MTITVPTEISDAVMTIASQTGQDPEELLLRALRAHFPPIPADLQAEFDAWEQASDEDGEMVDDLIRRLEDKSR